MSKVSITWQGQTACLLDLLFLDDESVSDFLVLGYWQGEQRALIRQWVRENPILKQKVIASAMGAFYVDSPYHRFGIEMAWEMVKVGQGSYEFKGG